MSILKLKAGEPAPVSAPELFGRVMPQMLSHHQETCRRLGGRYAFALTGEGGGAWTIDYPATVVHEGLLDADIVVAMPVDDFAQLMRGTLDVERATRAGRIRMRGDKAALKNLVAILHPAS